MCAAANWIENFFRKMIFQSMSKNVLWNMLGLIFRALIQAGYLIVLSRNMGAEGYGAFAGLVSLAILLSPLSGWGVAYVLIKRLSNKQNSAKALLASAIKQILISGFVLLVLMSISAHSFFSIDIRSIILLGVSELILVPISLIAVNFALFFERGSIVALAMCLVPVFRLFIVIAFLFIESNLDIRIISEIHFYGSMFGALISLCVVYAMVGTPDFKFKYDWSLISEGNDYVAGSLVSSMYTEADKIIILQMLGAAALGPYAVAFRVVSVFLLPITALASVVLPRLFALTDLKKILTLIKGTMIFSVAYGLLAAVVLKYFAPMTPLIFGAEFFNSIDIILLLFLWPLIYAIKIVSATALTGIGSQRIRVYIESAGLFLMIILNIFVLPLIGITGSALSLLIIEMLIAIFCGISFFYQIKHKGIKPV